MEKKILYAKKKKSSDGHGNYFKYIELYRLFILMNFFLSVKILHDMMK